MHFSAQKKPSFLENPFLRVKPSAFVRQRSSAAGAKVRWLTATGGLDRIDRLPAPRSFSAKEALKAALSRGLVALVVFALLPAPLQQSVFQTLGLGHLGPSPKAVQIPLPVEYAYVSSPFGQRWGRPHQGIDLAAQTGQPIYAIADGTVTHSGWEPGYGQSVVMDHGHGLETRYAHCSQLLVPVGQVVTKGQPIAKVGSSGHSTGPHLHFEVLVKGVRKNPAWYYPFKETPQHYWLTVRKK